MDESKPSFEPGRKWRIAMNAAFSALAVALLAVMANWFATRHYTRVKLTDDARFSLSPLTQRVLNNLTNDLETIIFFDREHPLYSSVDGLLEEYKHEYPEMKLRKVDYLRNTAEAQEVLNRFALESAGEPDLVLFASGDRYKAVRQGELSNYDYDLQAMMSGTDNEVRRTHFRGEALFTAAIIQVTQNRRPQVFFLQGHGEHDPTSDRNGEGYSQFSRALEEKNIQIATLTLGAEDDAVPDGCDLLIVAGPRDKFLPEEIDKIDAYLKQGGRLLCLFHYQTFPRSQQTGLESLLADWGVRVARNVVQDVENQPSQNNTGIMVQQFESHPIVNPLIRSRLFLYLPREITKSGQGEGVEVSVLAKTGAKGRTLSGVRDSVPVHDPSLDRTAAIPVMAAAQKGGIQGVSSQQGTTRIVVAGDSVFLSNGIINMLGNRDFAALAVNWLLDRNEMLAISPAPVQEYRIHLNQHKMNTIRWLLMAGMPGAVLAIGALVWIKRRA